MDSNSKIPNILLVSDDDDFIFDLLIEIQEYGYNVTPVRSFSELYERYLKEDFDLIILTDFGLLSDDIISCAKKIKEINLSFFALVRNNNIQLINELADLNIEYWKFPFDYGMLRIVLLTKLNPKYRLSSEPFDWSEIEQIVNINFLKPDFLKPDFEDKRPSLSFWDNFFKKFNISKKKTYLDKFYSLPGMKKITDYFDIMNKDGTTEDVIPNGIGRFGYDVTNPIPTNNVFSSNAYLARLRDKNGKPIKYERLGSTYAHDISDKPIDKYKISDANGKELGTIYISPYQKIISKKAPEGFIIK